MSAEVEQQAAELAAPRREPLPPWAAAPLQTLLDARREGRLGHAILICGPAGLGKRALAEALCEALLCRTPTATGHACGSCRSCALAASGHPDRIALTFAPNDKGDKLRSELSVEQMRQLGARLALTPQAGGAQVALVFPADKMNAAAENALLKTLEEPMPGRFLLLLSDEPARLVATIRSRCQRVEVRLPPRAEALAALQAAGHPPGASALALDAARGHPGLAARWLADGGLALREQVLQALAKIAGGRLGPLEAAPAWLADGQGAQRLVFAAELARELFAAATGAGEPPKGLTLPRDVTKLSAWFDAANRVRSQLDAPIRHDLAVAGLLRDWRAMY